MNQSSTLEVWNCRKCSSLRSAPCGGVCLPGDYVSRESTQPLADHPSARRAWVEYAINQGHDPATVTEMTTNELIAEFGASL